jgi:putative nucleotidyltransferase with HDIG domain
MMNPELEKTIQNAGDLPTIPVIATKVLQMLENERVNADQLAKVVASDPAVAARVLKISNSAFYGCQRQIQTLSSAIVILGFNTLKSLVVAASVKQVYKPFGLTEKMLWEHSFGAGLAARLIASNTRIVNEEEAFLAGLFHDIGKIIMNSFDKNKFQNAIQRCYNENLSFEEVEKTTYDYTHAEVGAYVIKKWNFPEILTGAVFYHHHPEAVDPQDVYLQHLTAVVNLAHLFCLKAGVGEKQPQKDLVLSEAQSAAMLNLDEARITPLLEQFQKTFEKDHGFFVND